jgi:hypothetical protein
VNYKGEQARRVSVDTLFTRAEAKQLARLCETEDRSMSGVVHWVVRRFLRGELVARKRGGGR